MVAVLEQRYPNATEQKILLQGNGRSPGQNYLLVRFFGPVGSDGAGRTNLRDRPISSANIGAEMRGAFPGTVMGRSPLFVQNRYGPFGYAAGRSASGDNCFYGWQRISDIASGPRIFSPKGSIQIRLRLCSATASAEELLYVMYGFSIKAAFGDGGWNPYGSPDGPDASLGKGGAPIYPSGPRELDPEMAAEPALPASVPAPAARRARARPASAVVVRAAPLPAPIGPAIPLPPAAASTRESDGSGRAAQPDALPSAAVPSVPTVPSPPTCAKGEGTGTTC